MVTRYCLCMGHSWAYDRFRRKQAVRRGREKGCWVFVPADELVKAGINPNDPPPLYRIWATPKGGLLGRFYREP